MWCVVIGFGLGVWLLYESVGMIMNRRMKSTIYSSVLRQSQPCFEVL